MQILWRVNDKHEPSRSTALGIRDAEFTFWDSFGSSMGGSRGLSSGGREPPDSPQSFHADGAWGSGK
jgi:hypothetical protein